MAKTKTKMIRPPKPCKCGERRRKGQRSCQACHAASMRAYRSSHPLDPVGRYKAACRAAVCYALKRGKIARGPCVYEMCSSGTPIEAFHQDYSRPLKIIWICRDHRIMVMCGLIHLP
jgi:hypothetical protein